MKNQSLLTALAVSILTILLLSGCSQSENDKQKESGQTSKTTTDNSKAAMPDSKGDENSPRRKVETAVAHGLTLLEKDNMTDFIKNYMPPQILEQILKKMPIKELAKSLTEKRMAHLKSVLAEAKGLTPEYNKNKDLATYKLKEPKKPLVFFKLEGYWYLK